MWLKRVLHKVAFMFIILAAIIIYLLDGISIVVAAFGELTVQNIA